MYPKRELILFFTKDLVQNSQDHYLFTESEILSSTDVRYCNSKNKLKSKGLTEVTEESSNISGQKAMVGTTGSFMDVQLMCIQP